MISKHLRSTKGIYKGLNHAALAAVKDEDGKVSIGAAKLHKGLDERDPKRSMQIAIGRANKDSSHPIAPGLVEEHKQELIDFITRTRKYFKTNRFTSNTMAMILANVPEAVIDIHLQVLMNHM